MLITTLLIIPGLFAHTAIAEQEKAFVEKYKAALARTLQATRIERTANRLHAVAISSAHPNPPRLQSHSTSE
jgi:hypothetical protein